MRAWAFVPARGGSKSIKNKNLAMIAGRPMIDYGIAASKAAQCFERIICSTDNEQIAERARMVGVEVDPRPEHLAGDDTAVADVVREFLSRTRQAEIGLPDVVVLVQPTSPFVTVADIERLLDAFAEDGQCRSAQTICKVPHNHHALNQRQVSDGRVKFLFAAERKLAYNKQRKTSNYVFGNLVAARSATLLEGGDFFAEPSAAVEIEPPYDLDVDGPYELKVADALVRAGAVHLAHIGEAN